jgi:hypothetical protein
MRVMAGSTTTAPDSPASVWDCGQRHGGRPWRHLALLGVLLLMNLAAALLMPFIHANSGEPAAAWIALALLVAITSKLAATGLFRKLFHLERVVLGSSGLTMMGAGLAHIGARYRQVEVFVAWRDVAAVDVNELGEKQDRGAAVEVGLDVAPAFGRQIRLVFSSRGRAQAFAARALALRPGSAA